MEHDSDGFVRAAEWENYPQTKEETLERLRQSPKLYRRYQMMSSDWKERFLDFCQGKKSLPLTYDPFFKYMFDPEIHGDRLSRLVSSLLGFEVRVLRALSSEDRLISGESYLIMDLLVESSDGSLINVEIQKQGYAFPAERISCYSADLVMRQYMRAKANGERKKFSYTDIKKVYVIVLFEESPSVFHQFDKTYRHYGKTVFDSGLNMELLQEFFLISLDVFRKIPYSERERSDQQAWLSLFTTENLEDAQRLIRDYPWLEEIYREIAMLRRKPEEVLGMWSDALRILDENSMKFYVEQLEEKVRIIEAKVTEKVTAEVTAEVTAQKDKEIQKIRQEKDAEIEALKRQIEELKRK